MNEAFTFYGSFLDAIKELEDADRLAVYDAICTYGITGEVPELSGVPSMAFKLMRPIIDANLSKRAAGKKGGESTGEADAKQTASKPQAEAKQPASNKTEQNKTEQNKTKKREGRFAPPSVDEVAEYVRERGSQVDPEAFVDFYASKGWKVGSQPMKDWRAAVRTWEKRTDKPQAPPGIGRPMRQTYVPFDHERKDNDYDSLQKELARKTREEIKARLQGASDG